MILLYFVSALSLVFNVAVGTKDAYWIAGGSVCRRGYGEEDRCIHYSNCVPSKPGVSTKGYPDFCRLSGTTPILCCIESKKLEYHPGGVYEEGKDDKKKFPPLPHAQAPYQPYTKPPSPPKPDPIWGYGHYPKIHDTHDDHYWHHGGYEDNSKAPYDFPFNVRTSEEPDYSDESCEQDKEPGNPFQNGYHPFHPFNGNWPSPTTSKPQPPPPSYGVPKETTTERILYTTPTLAPTPQQTSPTTVTSTTQSSTTQSSTTQSSTTQSSTTQSSTTQSPTTQSSTTEGATTEGSNPLDAVVLSNLDIAIDQRQDTPQQDAGGSGGQLFTNSTTSNATSASINIQNPYVRPSFRNTTYLQKCGEVFRQIPLLKSRHTPILGGRDARPQEFPHLALLGYGEASNIQWLCGGSLISDQYVLTAAHCIVARGIGVVQYIRLGELDLNNSTEDADVQDYVVRDIIRHPLYSPLASYHDIALIRLNATVSFSRYIRPICLATTRELDNKIIVAAGWGLTEYGGVPATILQRATLKYVSFERCRTLYGTPRNLKNGILDDIHICADGGKETRDSCQGDSGGPLQYTNYEYNEENLIGFVEVVGITSFGKGCGLTAGVYTRVLPYVGWIERIVWPNEVS